MPIQLDARLQKIASLIGTVGCVADVGCDHGKLSYYLVGTERAERVIATDISAPSLQKARELALQNGVSHLVDTRLGDGLSPIKSGEADVVVIAGMGGDLIADILEGARLDNKQFNKLVLSANTHAEKVRRQIEKNGCHVTFDDMVECGRKWYSIIVAELGKGENLTEKQIKYGAFYKSAQGAREFLKIELQNKKNILENNPNATHLIGEIDELEQVLR